MGEKHGSAPLFAVFLVSILLLLLIPYTVYKFFFQPKPEVIVEPWKKKDKKKEPAYSKLKEYWTTEFLIIYGLWIVTFLLVWYVSIFYQEGTTFDPFVIMDLQPGASVQDIKSQYRKLSRLYHPDKTGNDPEKTDIFKRVVKAYNTLTDDVARENYEKYGDPDGPTSMELNLALPNWMFPKDRQGGIFVLIILIMGGIIGPLLAVAYFLVKTGQTPSPNHISQRTLQTFLTYGIKEFMGVAKVPEGLALASEFEALGDSGMEGYFEVRNKLVAEVPDLKDKQPLYKRRPYMMKALILLHVHLNRLDEIVPAPLKPDLAAVRRRVLRLTEEFTKVAMLQQRGPAPELYAWLAPTQAAVEMSQYISQAVAPRTSTSGRKTETVAPLLQLPHMTADGVKKLTKKKVKTLQDLLATPSEQLPEVLAEAGYDAAQAADVGKFVDALPVVAAKVHFFVEGEEGSIKESDVITCRVTAMVTRAAHKRNPSAAQDLRGGGVAAYTPNFPFPKQEYWWVLLADVKKNGLVVGQRVQLLEAERIGAQHPEKADALAKAMQEGPQGEGDGSGAGDGDGQHVDLKFQIRTGPGTHSYLLFIMSDSYLGMDVQIPVKLKVAESTAEEKEARANRVTKVVQMDSDGEIEMDMDDDADDEDEDDEDDYASNETGSEVTADDDEDEGQDDKQVKKTQ